MEPINWLAVIVGAAIAAGLGIVWHRGLFPREQALRESSSKLASLAGPFIVMLIGSAMLGHSFARIGADRLAEKPWLYFMQSGGVALAFIMPALWLVYGRTRLSLYDRLGDILYWLVAYLLIGATFWALS